MNYCSAEKDDTYLMYVIYHVIYDTCIQIFIYAKVVYEHLSRHLTFLAVDHIHIDFRNL